MKIKLTIFPLLIIGLTTLMVNCDFERNNKNVVGSLGSNAASFILDTLITKRVPIPDTVFIGTWNWDKNSESRDFSIKAFSVGDSLLFSYCAVFNNGAKIDCADHSQYNFRIFRNNVKVFEIPFESFFTNTKGVVRIEYLDNGRLSWQIIKAPDGDFFCPKNAILIKQPRHSSSGSKEF